MPATFSALRTAEFTKLVPQASRAGVKMVYVRFAASGTRQPESRTYSQDRKTDAERCYRSPKESAAGSTGTKSIERALLLRLTRFGECARSKPSPGPRLPHSTRRDAKTRGR